MRCEIIGNRKKIILVANTHKTILRIADCDASQKDRWQIIKDNFPIGEKMNENTHVFDGIFFMNANGQSRFFMTALPVVICEEFVEIGVGITGSVHRINRLDTSEHIIFRKYVHSCGNGEAVFVIFPHNDDSLRVLYITNGLPGAAHCISNDSAHRENEFLRFYETCDARRAILLTREGIDYEWLKLIFEKDGVTFSEEELDFAQITA
jgi:hypothetical protein